MPSVSLRPSRGPLCATRAFGLHHFFYFAFETLLEGAAVDAEGTCAGIALVLLDRLRRPSQLGHRLGKI